MTNKLTILHYNISIEKNLYEYRKIRLKLGKKMRIFKLDM